MRANVWIAVFSFIGNYFWTHYFYVLLGAEYTFRSWRLNDVSSCRGCCILQEIYCISDASIAARNVSLAGAWAECGALPECVCDAMSGGIASAVGVENEHSPIGVFWSSVPFQ